MRMLVGATAVVSLVASGLAPWAVGSPGPEAPADRATRDLTEGGGKVKLKVRLPEAEETVQVRWKVKGGKQDFVKAKGSVQQRAGTKKVTVTLRAVQDTLVEGTETFRLRVGGRRVTVTVTDDDSAPAPVPVLSAVDLSRSEAGTAFPQVRLDRPASTPVLVTWATAPGTATAGADYTAASGTAVLAPGQTAVDVPVAIANDVDHEQAETFELVLSNPSGATIGDGRSTITVTNDDPQPAVSVSDGPDRIENATTMPFTVTLDRRSWEPVSVKASTIAVTAGGGFLCESGVDFIWLDSATVSFAPGETSKQVNVAICEDAVDEAAAETFTVMIHNAVAATLDDTTGSGTILDDD